MDPINSNSVNNTSSARVYILAIAFLVLIIFIFVANFRGASCEQYLYLAQYIQQQYGIAPDSCLQHYLNKAFIPSMVMSLPFLFFFVILFFKERKKEYQCIKSKQEKISFGLSIFTVLIFLLSFVFIKSIHCEGFGCLGLAPLIAGSVGIFPPLIFGFSLWFLGARYQWTKKKFLAATVGLIVLLVIAYFQTPLL